MASPSLFRGPPAFAPRTQWPALPAVLTGLGVVAASFAGAVLAFTLCQQTLDAPAPRDAAAILAGKNVTCLLISGVAQQAAMIALTLFAAGFYGSSRYDALALRPPQNRTAYPAALFLVIAGVAVYSWLVWLMSPSDLARDLGTFLPIIRSDTFWLAFLVIGVGAPLSEELLFRGFLLPALARSRLGFAGAAALTAAAWTGLHLTYSIFGLLEVFLIGLFFSWLLWRTGSLWVPIVCHGVYNSIVLLVLRFLPVPL